MVSEFRAKAPAVSVFLASHKGLLLKAIDSMIRPASISRRNWMISSGAFAGTSILSANGLLSAQNATGSDVAETLTETGEAAETSPPAPRLSFTEPKIQHWRIGLILKTPVACSNVFATFPVPRDWPEQTVTVVGQHIDPLVTKWLVRDVTSGAKQVALSMARVPAGSTVQMTLDLKVERTQISLSGPIDDLIIPKRNERDLKPFFGDSPQIDASNARIKKVAKQLLAKDVDSAWQRVEQIYDWVRDNVKYTEGEIKNASVALKDGKGDCEEMTSLVVALCRNARIPARMVWVHEHCYPEFCLADETGTAHWFPCQAAGTRQFGTMQEYRPIMQKGDRFKVNETKSKVRYVAEYFTCDKKGKGNPKPTFIREPIEV